MLDPNLLRAKFLGPTISTVVGYHATSARAARAILRGQPFRPSRNLYDWLGDGVYFWEAAAQRARDWAGTPRVRTRLGTHIVVIGARIRLERCIDLHDIVWRGQIEAVYRYLQSLYARRGLASPRQTAQGQHGWDRLVLNQLVYMIYRRTGIEVGAVRASFREPDDVPI